MASATDDDPFADPARLLALSDGVFAFAITLLALTVDLPPQAEDASQLTPAMLDALRPELVSFVVSFLVIAMYWRAHHGVFAYVERQDAGLFWLNVVFLLLVALQPFPTEVLGEYTGRLPVVLYAATLAVTGLVLTVIWLYAAFVGRLLHPSVSRRMAWGRVLDLAGPSIVFLASIGVAYVDPAVAPLTWLLIAVVQPVLGRLTGLPADH